MSKYREKNARVYKFSTFGVENGEEEETKKEKCIQNE